MFRRFHPRSLCLPLTHRTPLRQQVPRDERGDVLMFMPGVGEINDVVARLSEYAMHTRKWVILPLHSHLSVEDQDK